MLAQADQRETSTNPADSNRVLSRLEKEQSRFFKPAVPTLIRDKTVGATLSPAMVLDIAPYLQHTALPGTAPAKL